MAAGPAGAPLAAAFHFALAAAATSDAPTTAAAAATAAATTEAAEDTCIRLLPDMCRTRESGWCYRHQRRRRPLHIWIKPGITSDIRHWSGLGRQRVNCSVAMTTLPWTAARHLTLSRPATTLSGPPQHTSAMTDGSAAANGWMHALTRVRAQTRTCAGLHGRHGVRACVHACMRACVRACVCHGVCVYSCVRVCIPVHARARREHTRVLCECMRAQIRFVGACSVRGHVFCARLRTFGVACVRACGRTPDGWTG